MTLSINYCREVSDVAKSCHQHISLNKSLIIASMLLVWQNSYSYRSFRDQQRAANCKCPLQGKLPRTPVHLRLEAEDRSSPALSRRPPPDDPQFLRWTVYAPNSRSKARPAGGHAGVVGVARRLTTGRLPVPVQHAHEH